MEQKSALVGAIPGQIRKAIEEEGIDYNVVVAGEGFSGKTSFIRSVFGVDPRGAEKDDVFFEEVCDMVCTNNPLAHILDPSPGHTPASVSVTAIRTTLLSGAVRVNLCIYKVTDVGDSVETHSDWVPVRNLILNRYEEYHMEEDRGANVRDRRIHACVYFLTPRAPPRDADISLMKQIGGVTNLVPLLSKADMLTQEDSRGMKKSIFSSLVAEQVQLFDSILIDEQKKVVELGFFPMPYSTPGRVYGHAQEPMAGERRSHTDAEVSAIRDLLIRSHAVDLLEVMEKYYEKYRRNKLVVEVLTATDPALDEDFKRKVVLEEARARVLSKRIEEKKKNYMALVAQRKKLIPEDLL